MTRNGKPRPIPRAIIQTFLLFGYACWLEPLAFCSIRVLYASNAWFRLFCSRVCKRYVYSCSLILRRRSISAYFLAFEGVLSISLLLRWLFVWSIWTCVLSMCRCVSSVAIIPRRCTSICFVMSLTIGFDSEEAEIRLLRSSARALYSFTCNWSAGLFIPALSGRVWS